MKKLYDKFNKIVFIAGMVALVILLLIIVSSPDDTIDGIWGMISMICILVLFVFGIFGVIAAACAIVEGIKEQKITFLKKFLSYVLGISIAYVGMFVWDYYREGDLVKEFEFGRTVLRIMVSSLALLAGEYMVLWHGKEK